MNYGQGFGNVIFDVVPVQAYGLIPGCDGDDNYIPVNVNFETGEVTDIQGNPVESPNSIVYTLPPNAKIIERLGG